MSTGDVTIPAIVVKAAIKRGWFSVEEIAQGEWSAETYAPGGLVNADGDTIQAAFDALAEVLRGASS